ARLITLALSNVATTRRAVDACVRQRRSDEANRTNRVVVSGNGVVDEARIAAAVRDRDDWDAQLARLRYSNLLLRGVDDEQSGGHRAHPLHAADVLFEASALFLEL